MNKDFPSSPKNDGSKNAYIPGPKFPENSEKFVGANSLIAIRLEMTRLVGKYDWFGL